MNLLITFLIIALIGTLIILTAPKIINHWHLISEPAFLTLFIDNPIRRRFFQKPKLIAERMHFKPGMKVVEIGPGKGNYTLAIAEEILPDGTLYAIDIKDSIINRLKKHFEELEMTNIIPKIDNAYELSFDNGSIDRYFGICCLPEIPDPIKVLRECYRVLKPNGLLCLCEWFPDVHYPRRKTVKRWAKEAGFELNEEFGNWFIYQLNFRKKPV